MNKFALALVLFASGTAQAADNLKFHGTLIAGPKCTIDNAQTIDVNFNNVLIEKIDGSNYSQPVPYTITCDSTYRDEAMSMTLTLSGTPVEFNNAAVATSVEGLGIELRQNNTPFTIGSNITIQEASRPTLTAVPVKKSGATLKEGGFEAWATLQVDYQ
ncbi:fimbrial protein [Enterobacter sp. ECC-175]|uniref:fimbrial protein n=1 Tax=unclassified Enterobacter TaxID=2608935 RepID=UPI000D3F8F80|nr:fimbrial protein [Enterobacter sp. RIT 418]RAU36696.1 fimbrial protein [Enterobacter sp. RIT 418]